MNKILLKFSEELLISSDWMQSQWMKEIWFMEVEIHFLLNFPLVVYEDSE